MQHSTARRPNTTVPALVCCSVGALLILASLVPLGKIAPQSQWTEEDAAAYDRVALEYKRSAYQNPGGLGLTEEEHAARVEKLKEAADAMRDKLEAARRQGDLWSWQLRWIGIATTSLGIVLHFAGRYWA